ncbi:Phosphatidylinositol-specific phospholipase C X domain-containing protein [Entamoeba marina]
MTTNYPHENWMGLYDVLNLSIRQVTLPGSHDCFSYDINSHSKPVAPFNIVPKSLSSVMRGWSITQKLGITEQLQEGIRYFDMRIIQYNKVIYTVHGLLCKPLLSLLTEIFVFLQSHPSEVVIVDINHCYDMNEKDHLQNFYNIISLFGDMLVPANEKNLSCPLQELVDLGQRVFIYYERPSNISLPTCIWSQNSIASYWPNKTNVNGIIERIENQGIEWIDNQRLKKNSNYSSSVQDAAEGARDKLLAFLNEPKLATFHVNVLLLDFVEKNDIFIAECITRCVVTSKSLE